VSEGRDSAKEREPVVVRDRRRIDPVTGEVRAPEGAQASPGADPGATAAPTVSPPEPDPADTKLAELAAQLDERTDDLQRVSAEYANYRRRVDRDREAVAVAARAQLAGELLTVLDDVARAEQHGDLTGAFKAVADKLLGVLTKIGVAAFGAEGDEFNPLVHEAVQHSASAGDDAAAGPAVTVVSLVLRPGYRIGERVLRPAMVAVTDRPTPHPSDPPEPSPGAEHGND
jgi:molecular chaperone GrpE